MNDSKGTNILYIFILCFNQVQMMLDGILSGVHQPRHISCRFLATGVIKKSTIGWTRKNWVNFVKHWMVLMAAILRKCIRIWSGIQRNSKMRWNQTIRWRARYVSSFLWLSKNCSSNNWNQLDLQCKTLLFTTLQESGHYNILQYPWQSMTCPLRVHIVGHEPCLVYYNHVWFLNWW